MRILIAVSLSKSGDFVAAYVRHEKGKVHKTVDYKNRGTVLKDYAKNGKLLGVEFLRANDFWRFTKALVIKSKKKVKKHATRN
jgi:uncharacterized protein YuzE